MAKETRKFLTADEWQFVRGLFLNGEPPEDIVKRFPNRKVSPKTIINKMSAEGLCKVRDAIQNKANEHMAALTEEDKIRINEKCIKLFDKGAEVIEGLLNKYREELVNNPNISKGAAKATAYNIDLLMSGATKVQKGYSVGYGLDKNGQLVEKEPQVLTIEGINMDKI